MMSVAVENGTMFYEKTRNRLNVEFDESLKDEIFALAQKFHKLVDSRETLKPEYSKECDNCSYKELCLSKILLDKKNTLKKL
jgi:CRISPR-associated exonuclease Cas4